MRPSFAGAVQSHEAFGAEEVKAVLAQFGGVGLLALPTHHTVQDPLQVLARSTSGLCGLCLCVRVCGVPAPVAKEKAVLHTLARRQRQVAHAAHQLLDVIRQMQSTLPCGVQGVEAPLAEEVSALQALVDGRPLLALGAHHNALGLLENLVTDLFLSDFPQELERVPQVRNDGLQVILLLDVGLECRFEGSGKVEFCGCVDVADLGQPLNHIGGGRGQMLVDPLQHK
mmetsp:Transcript_36242/g.90472  ORF Transcript_36242/g.90472 Transcript_36242/m.90472 type:complete len:227 (+) Transcript_36242:316-996(+)